MHQKLPAMAVLLEESQNQNGMSEFSLDAFEALDVNISHEYQCLFSNSYWRKCAT